MVIKDAHLRTQKYEKMKASLFWETADDFGTQQGDELISFF